MSESVASPALTRRLSRRGSQSVAEEDVLNRDTSIHVTTTTAITPNAPTLMRSSSSSSPKLIIGVCAMDTKARSKPMRHILDRLMSSGDFETILFGDKCILDEQVENWPRCDFLISFFSKGFPLHKAVEYVQLRKPFCVNDLPLQELLWDRRLVLLTLDALDVPTPNRLFVHRDGGPKLSAEVMDRVNRSFGIDLSSSTLFQEEPVQLVSSSALLPSHLQTAPAFRRPTETLTLPPQSLNASTAGAGSRVDITEMSQKTADLTIDPEDVSSSPPPDADLLIIGRQMMRKPFVEKPVHGEDHNIHIYYPSHAGGGMRRLFRKVANKSSEYISGVVDVRRQGSFIYEEFLDVDHSEDVKVYTIGPYYAHAETRKSPVVDGLVRRNVDGKEVRYVTALSDEEQEMARRVCMAFGQAICGFDLLRCNGRSYVIDVNGWSFVKGNHEYVEMCAKILREMFLRVARKRKTFPPALPSSNATNQWKLKSFVTVFRHADRTPKQKLKFIMEIKPFQEILLRYAGSGNSSDEVLLRTPETLIPVLFICRNELNRTDLALPDQDRFRQLQEVLQRKIHQPGTKLQLKPANGRVQLIIKWGGEFTHAGRHHAKDLGENLRKDLMLMNKKLLDDVKVYTSSERRAIATADVFCKALLLIAELPQDFLIISKEMLDDSYAAKEQLDFVKNKLQNLLRLEQLNDHGVVHKELETPAQFLDELVRLLSQHRDWMRENYTLLDMALTRTKWCCAESAALFRERWEKLFRDWCDTERHQLDPCRASELYDSLKFDALHNRMFLERVFVDPHEPLMDATLAPLTGASAGSLQVAAAAGTRTPNTSALTPLYSGNGPTHSVTVPTSRQSLRELFRRAKVLFDFVSPQEYGITEQEKLDIGVRSSLPLLRQIVADLEEASRPLAEATTRLYFTKESHVYTLLNVVLYCGLTTIPSTTQSIDELDYLTQVSFELYERFSSEDAAEYALRIGFSPGAHDASLVDVQIDAKHSLSVAPRRWLTDFIQLEEALTVLRRIIQMGEQLIGTSK